MSIPKSKPKEVNHSFLKPKNTLYYGVDISHWQPNVDFTKLKQDFVFHKCTEATDYIDPLYKERQKYIQGSYHFARGGDAKKEADWYLANCGNEQLVLDWEIEHADPVGWCRKFAERVKEKTGKECWLYTNDARAKKFAWEGFKHYWVARYGINNGKPSREPNFANWTIWQYTSRGRVDGISGYVDLNIAKVLPESVPNSPVSGFTKFSQNDPAWKNVKMGISNCTLGKNGSTTSSVATLGTWFGDTLTPKDYALNNNLYTKDGLILWKQIENISKKIKFLWRYYQFNEMIIDKYLNNPNTAVVLNVDNGYHWVSALKKVSGGYLASDPYPFPAVNRKYRFNEIKGFTVLQKK